VALMTSALEMVRGAVAHHPFVGYVFGLGAWLRIMVWADRRY
jgi:hypothetical protein